MEGLLALSEQRARRALGKDTERPLRYLLDLVEDFGGTRSKQQLLCGREIMGFSIAGLWAAPERNGPADGQGVRRYDALDTSRR